MKKIKRDVYEFNVKEELAIYEKVGKKGSLYHNYCEWNRYICEKYGSNKYTEITLENFVHYLKREQNVIITINEQI